MCAMCAVGKPTEREMDESARLLWLVACSIGATADVLREGGPRRPVILAGLGRREAREARDQAANKPETLTLHPLDNKPQHRTSASKDKLVVRKLTWWALSGE